VKPPNFLAAFFILRKKRHRKSQANVPQEYLKITSSFKNARFYLFKDWLSIKKGYCEIRVGYFPIRDTYFRIRVHYWKGRGYSYYTLSRI
jgi:hypothetical protein